MSGRDCIGSVYGSESGGIGSASGLTRIFGCPLWGMPPCGESCPEELALGRPSGKRSPGGSQRTGPGDPTDPGDPRRGPGDPRRGPGDPRGVLGTPERGPGGPRTGPGDPRRGHGDPSLNPKKIKPENLKPHVPKGTAMGRAACGPGRAARCP